MAWNKSGRSYNKGARAAQKKRLDAFEKELFERISSDIEHAEGDWICDWSRPVPQNPLSGAVYKGRNNLLLTYAMVKNGWEDPRFFTAKQAQTKLKLTCPSAGGFPCNLWRFPWCRFDDASGRWKEIYPQPKPGSAEEKRLAADPDVERHVKRGAFEVFHISQVPGATERLGEFVREEHDVDLVSVIDEMERRSPCPVIEEYGARAFWRPSSDEIHVPLRGQFGHGESFVRTLAHEQCHATGHHTRLDRKVSNSFGSAGYAREELTAELGALFCCNRMGLDLSQARLEHEPELADYYKNHVLYLKSWASGLEKPAEALMQAATAAQDACTYLMEECHFDQIDTTGARTPERTRGMGAPELSTARSVDGDLTPLGAEQVLPVRSVRTTL